MSAVMHGGIRRYGASDRAISYAVLLSLVLHAVLLFSFSMRPSKRSAALPGPIIAHLVTPPAPVAVPPAPQPEPPRPRVEEKPAPPVVKPVVKATPKPSPIPAPKAAPPQSKPAEIAPPPATPVVPAPSAPAQPSAPAAVARTEPQPAQNATEADSLREAYRMELIEVARKYKRYPRAAMDNNWEGRAVVRMTIGANGMISSISVTSSAGYEILDRQAQDMVQKAKGRVPIPAGLRGRGFTIEVPVIYNLKGDDAG